ncbi:MAG TPA: DUF4350 domain-containing protein [Candidatus Dormibacteraeota bacterium]|nr:DUF4350 domain-containing protein [Candidatus Dormibacteraeota bacterium]
MRGTRGWVIAAVAVLLLAGLAYVLQPHQSSPDHSSSSDAADGTSAARLFSAAMGHPTEQVAGTFPPADALDIMFVFTPTSPYTSADAGRLLDWVRAGGLLIYASEQGDPELDNAFGVTRLGALAPGGTQTANPIFSGVDQVQGEALVDPLDPGSRQVPILRATDGSVSAYLEHVGSGTVIVMADPLPLCNGYLDKADNGKLLADLLSFGGPNARVGFDEYHHGLIVSDFAPQAWITTAWGAALLWLLIAIFVGLFLRGRSFGPLIQRPLETPRSDVEWSVAVGRLLRRSSARAVTLGMLATATERAVASRAGLPVQPREQFWNALWVRSPQLAAELAEAEGNLHQSAASESGMLEAARRLHRIAHPVSEAARRGHPGGAGS